MLIELFLFNKCLRRVYKEDFLFPLSLFIHSTSFCRPPSKRIVTQLLFPEPSSLQLFEISQKNWQALVISGRNDKQAFAKKWHYNRLGDLQTNHTFNFCGTEHFFFFFETPVVPQLRDRLWNLRSAQQSCHCYSNRLNRILEKKASFTAFTQDFCKDFSE